MNPANQAAPYKTAVLGGGAVVREYYLPALKKLGWLSSVPVIECDQKSIAALKAIDLKTLILEVDFRAFLKNEAKKLGLEAVFIALPNPLHEEAVDLALDAHLNVLCEKPLTMKEESCRRLAEKARQNGVYLSVGMVRRYTPAVVALKKALANGFIGRIRAVKIEDGEMLEWDSRSSFSFKKENGGVLANMGIHFLDFAEDILGGLEPVSYEDDSRGGVEANCDFKLKNREGIPVSIKMSNTHQLKNQTAVEGDKGTLFIKKNSFDRCFFYSKESGLTADLFAEKPFESGSWPHDFSSCFIEEFFIFSREARANRQPPVSAENALSAIRNIEWAYKNRGRAESVSIAGASSDERSRLSPSRVVVTGGGGFIGCHLVERLVQLGFDDIVVPVRRNRSSNLGRFPVKLVRTDLLNESEVNDLIKGARYVFHLAYGSDGDAKSQREITVRGTQNVVEACIRQKVESVVITSTISILAGTSKNPIDESSGYARPSSTYESSKIEMEKLVKRYISGKKSETRVVILNPGYVYGPGGKAFTLLPPQMAKDKQFCWIEGGNGFVNYVYVDNLVDALIASAGCPDAHGKRFIITDGHTTWKEFFTPVLGKNAAMIPSYTLKELKSLNANQWKNKFKELISSRELRQLIGSTPLLKDIKPAVGRWMRKKMAPTANHDFVFQSEPAQKTPPLWLSDIFKNELHVFSSESAKKTLGWRPMVSLKEGQKISVEWLKYVGFEIEN